MSISALDLVNTKIRVVERAAPFRLGYRPALDGLRGVAILSVLAVHTHHAVGWSLLRGGNIGVDIFFVLSGFLITVLLLEEWQRGGSISLKSFYWRRILRLGPALLVLLAIMYAVRKSFLSCRLKPMKRDEHFRWRSCMRRISRFRSFRSGSAPCNTRGHSRSKNTFISCGPYCSSQD